ncbi:MAG TPA: methyltransferase domain-containing protein [Burkholderiales bacterium]|nr:methyltransferase domain-containing protein [Burkholderiales bacterium]
MKKFDRFLTRACITLGLALLVAGCVATAPPPNYSDIIAAPDRTEADRKNDERRKPDELLAFTGARPGMKVLDMGAGGGYSTELIARSVAPGGTVYSQSPADMFANAKKAYEERARRPAMKNAVRVERPFDDPLPPGVGDLDLITFFFFYHDTVWLGVDRQKMNRRMFEVLKPGGLLVLADHSARPGEGVSVAKNLHRIEESVVRRELEAAGFQFVSEARFLRNPDDPRTAQVQKNPVSNDEFVLKFRKPQ